MEWQNVALCFSFFVVGLFIRSYLPSYFSEKGKNLATKEDISDITQKIEAVKHEYSAQLESAKAQLSSQLKTHGFRYEKEFEILDQLTSMLVSVRNAALSLRPVFDHHIEGETESERRSRRLGDLFKTQRELFLYREKKRPFFAPDIYVALVDLGKLADSEGIGYQFNNPFEKGDGLTSNFTKYWEEAAANQNAIQAASDKALDLIRVRVTQWEHLQ